MASDDGQAPVETFPAPGLLVLTGASHTGKTSVARKVLRLVSPPAAFLSVDDVVLRMLARPPGDPWAQIPLAYELLLPLTERLLDRGWLVIFESTFTYVPETGSPEFHAEVLEKLVGIAGSHAAPCTIVQLDASRKDMAARAEFSGRLPSRIVSETASLHETAALPPTAIRLDSTADTPEELARRSLVLLDGAG